jgi:hypothetical protein
VRLLDLFCGAGADRDAGQDERDELVALIQAAFNLAATMGDLPATRGPLPMRSLARVAADALLAAGWHR